MTEMGVSNTTSGLEDELQEKKIQFLKTALTVYRSRSFSIRLGYDLLRSNAYVPEHMKNYECLRKQISGLHSEVALVKALQDSIDIVHNTLTCMGVPNLLDGSVRRKLQKTAEQVSHYSRQIIAMYKGSLNEIENIRMKREYVDNLSKCHRSLDASKNQENSKTPRHEKRWQKAETQVQKINIMREIKQILIGKMGCSSRDYPELQKLRTPHRRSLTVNDFSKTWDVCLPTGN